MLAGWLLASLAATSMAAARAATPPTLRIDSGQLTGIHDTATGVDAFKGIPYAAPPVGPLRWKPPQPVATWKGTRKADHFGPRCMQRPVFGDMVFRSDGMSEDCLRLNVWMPAGGKGQRKLPVLVYFYGGGFLAGDSSEPRYDGASLARKGIITVTVNYRLGVFGFLALPALTKESPHHASGNYGLLDQVAALRWVRRNIAAFGGDPERVTIGGESAGSMSVSALMASPLSKGLMQHAIGESGAVLANLAPQPLALAETQGRAFEKHAGADSLAQLRAMPARTLLDASADDSLAGFKPDIDGYFLPRSPQAIYQAGAQAHVPLLVGSNSQEGSYAVLFEQHQPPTPANYRAVMEQRFGKYAAEALKWYPGNDAAEVKASGTALSGDQFIAFATCCLKRRLKYAGDKAQSAAACSRPGARAGCRRRRSMAGRRRCRPCSSVASRAPSTAGAVTTARSNRPAMGKASGSPVSSSSSQSTSSCNR